MYNPFSIVSCLAFFHSNRNLKCFKPYWNNSGSPDLITYYLKNLKNSGLLKDLLTLKDLEYGKVDE